MTVRETGRSFGKGAAVDVDAGLPQLVHGGCLARTAPHFLFQRPDGAMLVIRRRVHHPLAS